MKNRSFYCRIRGAATAVCALLFAFCAGCLIFTHKKASADAAENGYYYAQLSPEAQRFYNAIAEMDGQGLLKKGNGEYDLVENEVLTTAQLQSFANSADVLVTFGAARDAYSLDHPETFYVDFTYLSVNVGKKSDGSYVATLGTGRAESYYIADGFSSESQVNAAIAALNAKIDGIVAEVEGKENTADAIRAVNQAIVNAVEYSFCATATKEGTVYEEGAAYIRNPYGALVNGKAVCEGYARAFKMVMDRLGVACVLVQGYSQGEGDGYEAHMWNYVQVDGAWYAVDVTWNDTTGAPESYVLRGNAVMKLDHVPDGVISEANYQFTYPVLNPYDYGVTLDENGIDIQSSYVEGSSEDIKLWQLNVSYKGKSAQKLAEEESLYIALRYGYLEEGVFEWTVWAIIGDDNCSVDKETYSAIRPMSPQVQYVQFAIISCPPDFHNISYSAGVLDDKDIGALSEPYINYAYGTYAAPPYVKTLTPSNQSSISAEKTYEVVVTYTENLKIADVDKPIGVVFTSQHSDITNYAAVQNVTWDSAQPDTLKFTFTPSKMFNHRYETYSFYPVNLVGADSGKEPNSFSLMTEQTSVACNKVFNDGTLYIKSYGEPSLVSAGDLSLTGWTDGEGNYIAENQRSQLVLVATKPDEAQSGAMIESVTDALNVSDEAVLASQTFELELDICSHIANIPAGSYLQLSFGFPAGYGPEDEGVTFKVYHFKRNADGSLDYDHPEELDCVITQYGLIVTVTDFSPFAVVALDKQDVPVTQKAVYARAVGVGGWVDNAVSVLSEGESVTFTLSPEAGYQVERVLLNGESVEITGNSLTLAYDTLEENNVLTVWFVAKSVAEREEQEGITPVYAAAELATATVTPVVTPSASQPETPTSPDSPQPSETPAAPDAGGDGGLVKGVIAVCVVLAVSVAVVCTMILVRKRKLK